MTRILINGACGRMGRAIAEIAAERGDCTVVGGMDKFIAPNMPYEVTAPFESKIEADVLIDVSNSSSIDEGLMEYAISRKMPIVVCTTGHSDEQRAKIKGASLKIPVFYTGNMSLGINVLSALAKRAAQILGATFDIEIVEAHHNKKLDAPSGTALMLANSVSQGLAEQPVYTYDRHSVRQERRKEEIGIHSIRGGTIVGEHSVIFAGPDEVLTLSHSAGSRKMFAAGAVNAAAFLADKKTGMYDMNALLGAL